MKLNYTFKGDQSILITNNVEDPVFDISIGNSIRRALYTSSHCYSINDKMSQEQKNIYNKYFNTSFAESEVIYSVSYDNYYNKQTFSHRLTLVPLYYSLETKYLLERGLYLLFTDPLDTSKPFINTNSEPKYIYTSDLRFMYLNPETDKMEDISMEEKNMLIKYNVPVLILLKDNGIHIIGNPQFNCGYEGGQFEPVCIQYNFGPNSNPKYVRKDKFGNPNNIEIIVEFNGIKELKLALNDAFNFLIYQFENLKKEYNAAMVHGSDIVKLINNDLNIQIIYIYNNEKKLYLADHTIGNLLSSHLLYTMEKYINEYDGPTNIEVLNTKMLFSYISPDENLLQRFITIKYQISDDMDFLTFLSKKLNCENNLLTIKQMIFNNVCDLLINYYRMNLI